MKRCRVSPERDESMNEEENRQNDGTLSEKRKNALLRYLAVLLLVAFVFVALSLVLQMHNSQTTISELSKNNSSALANAEQLQEQNRQLQDEAREQRETIAQQQEQIKDLENQLEALTKSEAAAQTQAETLDGALAEAESALTATKRAYDALITALGCQTQEGNVTFSRAIDTVEANKAYLSDQALAVYESLLGNH